MAALIDKDLAKIEKETAKRNRDFKIGTGPDGLNFGELNLNGPLRMTDLKTQTSERTEIEEAARYDQSDDTDTSEKKAGFKRWIAKYADASEKDGADSDLETEVEDEENPIDLGKAQLKLDRLRHEENIDIVDLLTESNTIEIPAKLIQIVKAWHSVFWQAKEEKKFGGCPGGCGSKSILRLLKATTYEQINALLNAHAWQSHSLGLDIADKQLASIDLSLSQSLVSCLLSHAYRSIDSSSRSTIMQSQEGITFHAILDPQFFKPFFFIWGPRGASTNSGTYYNFRSIILDALRPDPNTTNKELLDVAQALCEYRLIFQRGLCYFFIDILIKLIELIKRKGFLNYGDKIELEITTMFQFQNQLIHNESTFKGTDSNSIDMSLAIEPAGIYLQMPGSIVQTFESNVVAMATLIKTGEMMNLMIVEYYESQDKYDHLDVTAVNYLVERCTETLRLNESTQAPLPRHLEAAESFFNGRRSLAQGKNVWMGARPEIMKYIHVAAQSLVSKSLFVVIQWEPMDSFGRVPPIVLDQAKKHCDSLIQFESQYGRPKLNALREMVEKNGGQSLVEKFNIAEEELNQAAKQQDRYLAGRTMNKKGSGKKKKGSGKKKKKPKKTSSISKQQQQTSSSLSSSTSKKIRSSNTKQFSRTSQMFKEINMKCYGVSTEHDPEKYAEKQKAEGIALYQKIQEKIQDTLFEWDRNLLCVGTRLGDCFTNKAYLNLSQLSDSSPTLQLERYLQVLSYSHTQYKNLVCATKKRKKVGGECTQCHYVRCICKK